MGNPTPTTIKNEARAKAFAELLAMCISRYGTDEGEVVIIGDSEIAVHIDNAPTGESIYEVLSPTIKDYCDRKTKTKTIKAFDVMEERAKFSKLLEERAEKAEQAKINKAKKIERDRKAREKRQKEREQNAQ